MDMYPDNVYIQNHEEIVQICENMHKDMHKDMLVAFVVFDKRHGLEHNNLAQAQYKHWRAVETGADSLLSLQDKKLLGLIESDEEETEAAD